jgi:hypothetical protein|tara:strand:- start:1863 stop:2135 length:273 start_codon:yes stop_codon:yes gene_type:complete
MHHHHHKKELLCSKERRDFDDDENDFFFFFFFFGFFFCATDFRDATPRWSTIVVFVVVVVGVFARFWGMSSESSSLLWNPSSSFWCNDFY